MSETPTEEAKVRPIVTYGDPVLQQRTRLVRERSPQIGRLLDELTATRIAAPGVGLAAPQVGEALRVCVALYEDEELRLVNPKIVRRKGATEGTEGCLSLPGLQGTVVRPAEVVVQAHTESLKPITVKAEGFFARILCHEVDHLDGRLFVERADPESLHWTVPDEESESGYRTIATSLEEALEAFVKMRRRGESCPEPVRQALAKP
jgi:peptide deformylase